MRRTRPTTNPWEPELLRLGRRKFLRGAAAAGGALALGGFGSLESAVALTQQGLDSPFLRFVWSRRERSIASSSTLDVIQLSA